ncbi:hypothetical protein BD289DRAFT_478768 [Coniella lustricola]|uniref:Uncharacterized protein n=1 Tax=Coniella lustricola TaxID=2025994 RepID=A0A2T3AKZ6_9PEZI|nr:hypothetical protein BD289DRAFT_478768 [Coniella lustricola]
MTDRYGHPRQSIFNRRHASAAASVSYSSTSTAHQTQHTPGLPGQAATTITTNPGADTSASARAAGVAYAQQHHHHHNTTATSSSSGSSNRRNHLTNHLTRRPQPVGGSGNGLGGVGGASAGGTGGGFIGGRSRGGGGGGGAGVLAGYDGVDGDEDAETLVVEDDDDGSIIVRNLRGEVELDEPPILAVEDPDEIVLDMRQENERERQKLAEAVKQHQSHHKTVPAQPEEFLEVLKASLRAKVAALTEDNWMYEKEEEPRIA